jgi:hypothetical protein
VALQGGVGDHHPHEPGRHQSRDQSNLLILLGRTP